jgi:tetratricopeptide (TPR) repeat protein
MVFGLVGVFVLLPRWQDQRQSSLANGEAVEGARSPDSPTPTTPEPVANADSTISEPHPIPTPILTPTPRPVPASPRNTPRRQQSTAERQYIAAMSEGLTALENRRWQAAQSAFEQASRLRPDAPEVADGLARAKAGRRLETIADGIRRARENERNEAWREAEKTYSAVLAIDPESAEALDGRSRTDLRATLDEKLEFHIATPGRLSTAKVFADAASALEEALDTVPSGPRLESQIARLEALLTRASTPVAVVLESDEYTDVVVHRVGRLGTFSRRELNLKPGAYTVVGSRDGYRDVRLRLVVPPGSPPKPLAVKCTERL